MEGVEQPRRSLRLARGKVIDEIALTLSGDPPCTAPQNKEAPAFPVPRTHQKRKAEPSEKPPRKYKKARNKNEYAPPEVFAHLNPLTDRLKPGLDVLFCGINPGVKSAEVGYHFANPSNHFWKCLHASGLTSRLLKPSEESLLPTQFNLGLTDLVDRPSTAAAQLSKKEMIESVPTLLAKIMQCRPAIVCFVGGEIGNLFCAHVFNPPRIVKWKVADEKYGLRKIKLVHPPDATHLSPFPETLFFVLPSTSGANASYHMPFKVTLLESLRSDLNSIKAAGFDTTSMTVIPIPANP